MEQTQANEIVDIEAYVKAGKPIPHAKKYRIKIGNQVFEIDTHAITGREILELAGKAPPEDYEVFQKLHHGELKPVGLDEVVDLRAHGVERFVIQPLENKDG